MSPLLPTSCPLGDAKGMLKIGTFLSVASRSQMFTSDGCCDIAGSLLLANQRDGICRNGELRLVRSESRSSLRLMSIESRTWAAGWRGGLRTVNRPAHKSTDPISALKLRRDLSHCLRVAYCRVYSVMSTKPSNSARSVCLGEQSVLSDHSSPRH